MKDLFVQGARATGTADRVIQNLWETNEAAADYSFNKSHAACYALIAYRTAWLKANYPAEYMAALISSVMSTKDKVPFFVSRCEEMGIEVLPPDVNLSGHDFVVAGGNIRFGLDAVKNVGSAAVDAILTARDEAGPFTSIWDFCERVDGQKVNKKAIESLIKCGALDSTGASRRGMLEVLPQAQSAGQKIQQDAQLGQSSIFDLDETPATDSSPRQHLPVPSLPDERAELNAMEKETLGLFLSSHPFKEVRAALRLKVDCGLADLAKKRDGEWVTVGGMISEAKKIRTKKGDPMLFATLDDLEAQVEILVFSKAYAGNADKIDVDKVVVVRGRIDHKEQGETKVVVQECEPFEPSEEEAERAREQAAVILAPPRLKLRVPPTIDAGWLEDLKELVKHNRGDHEIVICVGDRTLVLGEQFRVSPGRFCAELQELPGAPELV
jgi:DNA polymerase-3 subunit alpha